MGHEEHGGTWHMDAAQLDTQRKKGEAILKTSSTVYSTNRSSSSTRPAKLQLDRAEKSTVKPEKCDSPHEVMAFAGKDPLRAPISLALEIEVGWISLGNDPMPPRFDSHWLTPCF
ncbi:unnamed protein product [Microthlaspi erraticum]|uniref:Uncharacterized protein n=1 Tax=Microthlaspi erraticum TaxID=1685480 RepID=A0A6D2K6S9_9BRAS|nr:unnamed protein product [Microthlaspi erraticum]